MLEFFALSEINKKKLIVFVCVLSFSDNICLEAES